MLKQVQFNTATSSGFNKKSNDLAGNLLTMAKAVGSVKYIDNKLSKEEEVQKQKDLNQKISAYDRRIKTAILDIQANDPTAEPTARYENISKVINSLQEVELNRTDDADAKEHIRNLTTTYMASYKGDANMYQQYKDLDTEVKETNQAIIETAPMDAISLNKDGVVDKIDIGGSINNLTTAIKSTNEYIESKNKFNKYKVKPLKKDAVNDYLTSLSKNIPALTSHIEKDENGYINNVTATKFLDTSNIKEPTLKTRVDKYIKQAIRTQNTNVAFKNIVSGKYTIGTANTKNFTLNADDKKIIKSHLLDTFNTASDEDKPKLLKLLSDNGALPKEYDKINISGSKSINGLIDRINLKKQSGIGLSLKEDNILTSYELMVNNGMEPDLDDLSNQMKRNKNTQKILLKLNADSGNGKIRYDKLVSKYGHTATIEAIDLYMQKNDMDSDDFNDGDDDVFNGIEDLLKTTSKDEDKIKFNKVLSDTKYDSMYKFGSNGNETEPINGTIVNTNISQNKLKSIAGSVRSVLDYVDSAEFEALNTGETFTTKVNFDGSEQSDMLKNAKLTVLKTNNGFEYIIHGGSVDGKKDTYAIRFKDSDIKSAKYDTRKLGKLSILKNNDIGTDILLSNQKILDIKNRQLQFLSKHSNTQEDMLGSIIYYGLNNGMITEDDLAKIDNVTSYKDLTPLITQDIIDDINKDYTHFKSVINTGNMIYSGRN